MTDINYRNGIGVFLINQDKKLWVGRRLDSNKYWQMPQGGIDGSETEIDAMLRELKEEIGTNKIKIIAKTKKLLKYKIPRHILENLWDGEYVGQSQRWFACSFQGEDSDINLNLFKPEFSSWKWIDPRSVIDIVIPFKKKMYSEILEEFKEHYL